MSAVHLRDVVKIYGQGGADPVTALDGLNFSAEAGDYTAILGRSGCGKSTTVGLVLGLDHVTHGHVEVLGLDPARQFNALRGRIGCVFQEDRLLPWRTAIENVALPLELAGEKSALRLERAQTWLARLGLSDFAHALPHQLSGGMRQRVAIARAMVGQPDLIIADEAFSGLDAITGRTLLREFRELAREAGQTVLHITHSIDEALEASDRILVFGKPGRCIAEYQNHPDKAAILRDAILTALENGPLLQAAAE